MIFLNVIDEKGRFCGLKIKVSEKSGQFDTHMYSYVYLRGLYQEIGDIMGFDNKDFHPYEKIEKEV